MSEKVRQRMRIARGQSWVLSEINGGLSDEVTSDSASSFEHGRTALRIASPDRMGHGTGFGFGFRLYPTIATCSLCITHTGVLINIDTKFPTGVMIPFYDFPSTRRCHMLACWTTASTQRETYPSAFHSQTMSFLTVRLTGAHTLCPYMTTKTVIIYETVELRGAEPEDLELRHAEVWPSRNPGLRGHPLRVAHHVHATQLI